MRSFSGETYDHTRDGQRLAAQYDLVFEVMRDGHWRTLEEISAATGAPPTSVSARLRDMRKRRFGSHVVLRAYVARGLFRYQVIENTCPELTE